MVRLRDDRGAALVEFALVLPLLLLLLFGTLTGALAWNRDMSISDAARQGGRYGATLPTSNYASLDTWLTDVSSRVVASASNELDVGKSGRSICVAYVHPAGTATLDQTRSRTENASGTVTYANTACFTDSQATTETRVQVSVARTSVLDAGLWQRTLTLSETVVFRFEAG